MNSSPHPWSQPGLLVGTLLACSLVLAACSDKDKAQVSTSGGEQPVQQKGVPAQAAASAPAEAVPPCLITETSIHSAWLGMSYAEFKQAFAATHELVSGTDIKDTKKWEGSAASESLGSANSVVVFPKPAAGVDPQAFHADPRNALVFTTFADRAIEFGKAVPDAALLVEAGTFNAQCRTAEGVGPQQSAKDGLKRYKEFVIDFPRTYAEGEDPTNGLKFTARPAIYFVLDKPLEMPPSTDSGEPKKYAESDLKPADVMITEALVHHDLQTDMARSQVSADQVLEQDRQRPKTCQITATSMDRARLGMTYAELKKAYAGELALSSSSRILTPLLPRRFEQLAGATGEGIFGIEILLDEGGALYGLAPPETAKVIGLQSLDERCQTAEGVHTGLAVAEAAKIYGKAKPVSKEGAPFMFEQSPAGFQFNKVEKLVSAISVGQYFAEAE